MTPRLVSIELEGFRGIAELRRLELDAGAVVIRGDNGAGKTSLVDGVLWLFAGELPHLVDRVRGMRQVEDAVTNRYWPGAARVTLEVAKSGSRYRFTRRGNQKHTELEAICDGRPLVDPEQALAGTFGHRDAGSLTNAVTTWGLLRQDAVRASLDTAGGALHERLSGILGLERVSKFAAATTAASNALVVERRAARAARKRLAERHQEAVKRHNEAREQTLAPADARAMIRDGVAAVVSDFPPELAVSIPGDMDLDALVEFARLLESLREALAALERAQAAVSALEKTGGDPVAAAARELDAARASAVIATEQAPVRTNLALSALKLLSDRCPVCEQNSDEVSVRQHLEEMVSENQRLAEAAQDAAARVARAQTALAEAREYARRRTEADEAVRVAEQGVKEAMQRLARGGTAVAPAPLPAGAVAEAVGHAIDALRALYQRVEQTGDAHLARLNEEVEALQRELHSNEVALGDLDRRCADAKTLEHGAHAAAEAIVERALERLEPTFAEVFERLNPNPAFTELHARQDVFRNRNQIVPVVRDPERDVTANPLLVFSEGQLNVVALSYFLGMALNAREGALPFLVLDDPLQALDVLAILGFSDLCRRIRDTRQLIVTTHDRRFADVLVRKLSPRDRSERTIVHDFTAWTRDGPMITTREPELAEVIPLVRREAS